MIITLILEIIGYYEQDIEIDANSFTVFMIESIFKKQCFINENFSKEKIKFYMNLYKDRYNENTIKYFIDKTGFTPQKLFNL